MKEAEVIKLISLPPNESNPLSLFIVILINVQLIVLTSTLHNNFISFISVSYNPNEEIELYVKDSIFEYFVKVSPEVLPEFI